jgi:hypothetical protein
MGLTALHESDELKVGQIHLRKRIVIVGIALNSIEVAAATAVPR